MELSPSHNLRTRYKNIVRSSYYAVCGLIIERRDNQEKRIGNFDTFFPNGKVRKEGFKVRKGNKVDYITHV